MQTKSAIKRWAAAWGLALGLTSTAAKAQTAYAINNNDIRQLIKFNIAVPGSVTVVGSLLADGVPIELDALDYNLNDGNLYGYSYQYDEIFRVDTTTGVLTSVATPDVFSHSRGLGFQFQPVTGGFRLVDDAGDNFAFDSAFAGTMQTPLAYAAGDAHAGTVPRIGAIAFSNTVPGATTTTLYGIDYAADALVRVGGNPATTDGSSSDPASGRVQTVGALGFDTSDFVGFDIIKENGNDVGYAILTAPAMPTNPQLFRVNLATGATTQIGTIGGGAPLFGLAIQPSVLSGTLQFEAQSQATARTVQFVLKPAVGQTLTVTRQVPTSGAFSLFGVPGGAYTLHVSAPRFLAKNVAVTVSGDSTNAGTISLRAGDANGDNFADIADLLLLIAHYNQASPNAGYLDAVDFNNDGSDDIADLLILIGNYNAQGDPLP